MYNLKLHTIERFNSRQLSFPVSVLADDVTKVTNVKSVMRILHSFNQNE